MNLPLTAEFQVEVRLLKSPTKPRAKAVRFNLFFLEMIIVLLFFSIAAAIILKSFAMSDRLAKSSRRIESMAFCAQSAAEIFSETGSLEDTAEMLFGDVSSQILAIDTEAGGAETLTLTLSDDCKYFPNGKSLYINMSVTGEDYSGGVLKTLYINFEGANGELLYSMTAGAYIPYEWGDGE